MLKKKDNMHKHVAKHRNRINNTRMNTLEHVCERRKWLANIRKHRKRIERLQKGLQKLRRTT